MRLVVAVRAAGFDDERTFDISVACFTGYRNQMRTFASMGVLDA
jgi:hypothetical protein